MLVVVKTYKIAYTPLTHRSKNRGV